VNAYWLVPLRSFASKIEQRPVRFNYFTAERSPSEHETEQHVLLRANDVAEVTAQRGARADEQERAG
jgi:hypothetical protein